MKFTYLQNKEYRIDFSGLRKRYLDVNENFFRSQNDTCDVPSSLKLPRQENQTDLMYSFIQWFSTYKIPSLFMGFGPQNKEHCMDIYTFLYCNLLTNPRISERKTGILESNHIFL